ncbi:hypothetical protein BaOVIS_009590 [Babesia ovis]|uniref:Trafficking protein particle complex subunit 11 domain-containing protein n=1 Tax=Babesia ovis TaxID=5869 RepID=A0A9W5T9V6_BABOV|nr:hypothetical protein BaOVIS_009590 [Babesia ovis]
MDILPSHLMTVPVPCAALAIHRPSQERLKEHILDSGRSGNDDHNRLDVVVCQGIALDVGFEESPQWELEALPNADWVLLQRRLPPCVVCVRDWQHFVVDGAFAAPVSDDAKLESYLSFQQYEAEKVAIVEEEKSRTGNSEVELIHGDMKQLSDLIKADVERCLLTFRRNLLDKRPVPGKIMFLILLREGTKNSQKAVSGLKNLNANEVAAICVTSGEVDIANKITKLEDLVYDHCLAYYERRIHLLTKTLSKVKPTAGTQLDETSEINAAMLNFKLAYFHQFVGNFKESAQALNQAWSHVVPAALANPCEDYASVALYIVIQLISVHFACSSIIEALTCAFEAGSFFKRILSSPQMEPLYHNLCYLLYQSVALQLERANAYKELKTNDHLRQHAVNFGKWAICHLLKLRTALMSGDYDAQPQKAFAALLMRGDDDFAQLYSGSEVVQNVDTIQRRIKNLESITEDLLVKLMDILSTWSWYKTLLQITETLGDSFLLSSNLEDAFFIYTNVGEALVNSAPIDAEYLLKSCSSPILVEALKQNTFSSLSQSTDGRSSDDARQHPNFHRCASNMLLAEHGHSKMWWPIYKRILTKIMVTINLMLDQPLDIPDALLRQAGIPLFICGKLSLRNLRLSNAVGGSRAMGVEEREYALILLKSIMTLCSTKDIDVDFDIICSRLVQRIAKQDISTSVLLSKHHTPVYMIGQAEKNDHTIATELQLVVIFYVDLPFAIKVNRVSICTSIGTFLFDITKVVSTDDQVEIYIRTPKGGDNHLKRPENVPNDTKHIDFSGESEGNHSDNKIDTSILQNDPYHQDICDNKGYTNRESFSSVTNTVFLEGNRRVILAITCPPINNKFMIDTFNLLGLKLHWSKQLVDGSILDVACIIPSLENLSSGNGHPESLLFVADSGTDRYELLGQVANVGSSSALFKSEASLKMTMSDPKSAEMRSAVVETILSLTSLSQSAYNTSDWEHSEASNTSYVWGAYRMFVNRIYFKVFLGNMVEGHVAPVTCVLLYNKQILGADNLPRIRFSVDVSSSANSHLLYVLCKDERGNSGVMRQCVNNKFVFTLIEFADAEHFEVSTQLDTKDNTDSETVVPTLFADHPDFNCSINEDMNSFLELAKRDSNTGIVYIYGLLKILSHGLTNVQFSLKMQPMLGHTLKAVESKLLVVTDTTQARVYEPIGLELAQEKVYDNTYGNYLNILNMRLLNKSPLQYDIDAVRLVYDDSFTAENEQLYGFSRLLEDHQSLQFMHMCPQDQGNTVEVQCVHSVVHPDAFPFDRLQPCFVNVVTKALVMTSARDKTEIEISLKHESRVNLGEPFEMVADIRNMTPHTLDYNVTLSRDSSEHNVFLVAGPRTTDLLALPGSTNTVKWILVPNKCGHQALPVINVAQRRKITLSSDSFSSDPSFVYVAPRSLESMHGCGC